VPYLWFLWQKVMSIPNFVLNLILFLNWRPISYSLYITSYGQLVGISSSGTLIIYINNQRRKNLALEKHSTFSDSLHGAAD
jgi:hypothetical protein